MPIKSVILIGGFSVPVALSRAAVDTDIQLHEYHGEDGCRTCRKTLCSGCGAELTAEDIVKGYEYDGRFLPLLKDDLKKLKDGAENRIDILYSTSPEQLPPVFIGTSYIALPQAGCEKDFELLRLALSEERLVLIGRSITGGTDSYVSVSPSENGLVVSKLYLEDELFRPKKPYAKPPVTPDALAPVRDLLRGMFGAFDVSGYENEYQKRLRALIAAKIGEGGPAAVFPDLRRFIKRQKHLLPAVLGMADVLQVKAAQPCHHIGKFADKRVKNAVGGFYCLHPNTPFIYKNTQAGRKVASD